MNYLDYGARMYDWRLVRWFNIDPLAEKYYGFSPYVYAGNSPVRFIDKWGLFLDEYYSSSNGKYLGADGASTTYLRLIDNMNFSEISQKYEGNLSGTEATAALQNASKVINIEGNQIQKSLQSVADNSRASKLEHSTYIILDRESATIKSVVGPIGINDQVIIEYYPAPATGVSFFDKPGGPIIIGQAHGHPQSDNPNMNTQKTMSPQDVKVATEMQIPIYGIDAMSGRQGSPANIHRANPDGSINNRIGNTQNFNMGLDAMRRWGRSNQPK